MTKKKPPTKTKTTKPNLEGTIEAPPELSAAQKFDTAIRAKAHSLVQTAIADLWRFVEKPAKGELDPEVIELLAGREILKPPSLLEGALVGQMLNGLVIRSKVRIKPAPQLKTFGPFVTGNARTDGFFRE
jgi:hypothetical protein